MTINTVQVGQSHLVCLLQQGELLLVPLLHEGSGKHYKVELVANDSNHLPQKPPQGSQVVLFTSEELLEYSP